MTPNIIYSAFVHRNYDIYNMAKRILKDYKRDRALKVIKDYRVANMNYGLARTSNNKFDMIRHNKIMTECLIKARELRFYIWVNENGCTGHSYEKDYKLTSVKDHNVKEYIKRAKRKVATKIDVVRMPIEG